MPSPRLLSLLALCGLVSASTEAADPDPVIFDSFEYTGRDAVFEEPLAEGHFPNPLLAGFYPDPSICKVGEDYYLIHSTFAYFPGIPIFHSRDLINWKQVGHVITRPGQLKYDGLGVSRGIFAPAISHHDGTFYVICTMVDAGGNFVMTAKDPAGPWSDPIWFDFEGIDPSLFFDDDGRAWVVNNGAPEGTPLYDGHRAIWLQEFDPAAKKMIGPRKLIINGGVDLSQKPVWIEGPHVYRRGEYYYLCCAEGGTSTNHSQVIFRSKTLEGPWTPWEKNPILTQRDLDGTVPGAVTSTGHADLVEGPDGQWWSVFLACRPFAKQYYATGRETFLLPVTWSDDGWPRLLVPGQRVPLQVPAPKVNGQPVALEASNVPLTGNFTWRDEFNGPTLSPLWLMLRAPRETWWSLTTRPGALALNPTAEQLSGTGNPAFLARRLQHARFEASTTFEAPSDREVSGGLAIFQAESFHYYFGAKRTANGTTLFVERHDGKAPAAIATITLPNATRLGLKLTGDDEHCTFWYATRPGQWEMLSEKGDMKLLTTQAAGGFVGAVIGLHARIERQ